MATWGDFIKDIEVARIGKKMYAQIDQVIDLWEDRRRLSERVAELETELAEIRESCAQEIEEFARVCAEEADVPESAISMLEGAAQMIRASGQAEDEAGEGGPLENETEEPLTEDSSGDGELDAPPP